MRVSAFLLCSALFALSACKGDGDTVSLTILGDTAFHHKPILVNGIEQSGECRAVFAANLNGGAKDSATIVGGHVDFRSITSAMPMAKFDWDRKTITTIWPEPTIKAGSGRASAPLSVSMSLPLQEMEGIVTFDYLLNEEPAARTTNPFTFRCIF